MSKVRIVLLLSGLAAITACTKKDSSDPVVAEFSGKKLKASEAFDRVQTRLFDLEEEIYRLKEHAIQEHIENALLEQAASKAGMPAQALIDKEMGTDVGEVADAEVEEFLKSKGLSLDDPRIRKEDVRDYLKFRKRHSKRQEYVDKLKTAANVKILIEEPEAPTIQVETAGYPSWGNQNAPVTIIEFSDFQCPYCSRAVPALQQVKQEYGPDKVRIVFRDMPLPSHDRAIPAALAALCAHDQGKFWEMHDKLFENQDKLGDAELAEHAAALGVNKEKFKACYESKQHLALVEKSKREAAEVGISATPSFVINGTLMQGAQSFDRFKEKIDRFLKKKS